MPLFEGALKAYKAKRGPEHPDTLQAMHDLGNAYLDAGRVTDALALLEETLERRVAALGPDDPKTLASRYCLAQACLASKNAAAETLLRECLAIRERKGWNDWVTFENRSLLGASLLSRGAYAAAEPLLIQGFNGLVDRELKLPTWARNRPAEAGARIVKLYEAWGKKDLAAEWRKRFGE